MQRQQAGQNNPANPLMKAVSLTIDKIYSPKDSSSFKILASLSFKKSCDFIGCTKSKTGNTITVNFSLSLQRASFELNFDNDIGSPGQTTVRLQKIAHNAQANLKSKKREEIQDARTRKTSQRLSLDGGLSLKANEITPKIGARGDLSESTERVSTQSAVVRRDSIIDGISVTYSNKKILWEIALPSPIVNVNFEEDFLSGDVFAQRDGSKGEACRVVNTNPENLIITTGSVYIRMQDLNIGDVRFFDQSGEEIGIGVLFENDKVGGFRINERKTSILKQIIRKHLIEVGMTVEGMRLEVCRANV